MRQIADMGARALDDLPVGIDQCVVSFLIKNGARFDSPSKSATRPRSLSVFPISVFPVASLPPPIPINNKFDAIL